MIAPQDYRKLRIDQPGNERRHGAGTMQRHRSRLRVRADVVGWLVQADLVAQPTCDLFS